MGNSRTARMAKNRRKDNQKAPAKNNKGDETKKPEPTMKKQAAVLKQHKPANPESELKRQKRVNVDQKASNDIKHQQKSDEVSFQKKPLALQKDKFQCVDHAARLEATKKRLHESYRQAKEAKRRRTIQVLELHEVPKQMLGRKDEHKKRRHHNRQQCF